MKATRLILIVVLFFSGMFIKAQDGTPAAETAVQQQEQTDGASEAVEEGGEEGEEAKTGVITIEDIMVRGGWLMNVIAGLSLLAIALLFFYILSMRKGMLYPRSFIMEAQDAADVGDLEGLRDLCLNNGSTAAKIISAAL